MDMGSLGNVKSEINVTPLVDVVLVLLIIFMVVTPLLQRGYNVVVPPKSTEPPSQEPQDQLVVSLTADNQIYLNKEAMSQQALSLRLGELLKTKRDKTVFLSVDDKANYGRAVTIMDLARSAGAKNIGIVMEPVSVH
jgi:biopolymer transport protein TolR